MFEKINWYYKCFRAICSARSFSRDSFAYLSGSAIRRNRSMKTLSRGLTPVRWAARFERDRKYRWFSRSASRSLENASYHEKSEHVAEREEREKTRRMKKEHAEACAVRARALSFSLVGFNINILKTSFVASRQKGSSHVHNIRRYTQTFYFCILLQCVDENLSLIEDYWLQLYVLQCKTYNFCITILIFLFHSYFFIYFPLKETLNFLFF